MGSDQVLDLADAAWRRFGERPAALRSMLALIRGGAAASAMARELVSNPPPGALRPAGACKLLAPLPLPEQIRDFANYELHVTQALRSSMRLRAAAAPDPRAALEELERSGQFTIPRVWYEQPIYYKANRFSVIGPDAEVLWPHYAQKMDYELELAVVVGSQVKDADAATALEAVFGYTIYDDFSARDAQAREAQFRMGPAKGKDFDTGNAIGPCIVTRDEIADPMALRAEVRVNGQVRVRTTTGGMQHSIADCICHVTQSETLHPGEILALGTVGNGCGYESLSFLEPGDVVELEIEGIGVLRNRLIKPPPIR
jgi:2-keto-4-pentenoate hydratase/2-oxohepta-3-ene-1,7-dioic acid hydratase in catechol pathway